MAFVTRLSLRLGVVVLLGVVLLFGAGIFAATQVQQDLLPDISVPAVIAITPYPGASPEVVDEQVGVPVGNAMQGIAGADTVQTTSTQGASLVIVLFKDGTDIKSAEQDVNSALSKIRPLLPPQALSSTVQTFSTNSLPILEYAVSANEPLGDLSGQLRAQALPKLKGLAGVSSVVITGAPTDEVDVTLDPAKLAANRVTVTQVAAALQQGQHRRVDRVPQAGFGHDSAAGLGVVDQRRPDRKAHGHSPGDRQQACGAGADRSARHRAGRFHPRRHDHAHQRAAQHRPADHQRPERKHRDRGP